MTFENLNKTYNDLIKAISAKDAAFDYLKISQADITSYDLSGESFELSSNYDFHEDYRLIVTEIESRDFITDNPDAFKALTACYSALLKFSNDNNRFSTINHKNLLEACSRHLYSRQFKGAEILSNDILFFKEYRRASKGNRHTYEIIAKKSVELLLSSKNPSDPAIIESLYDGSFDILSQAPTCARILAYDFVNQPLVNNRDAVNYGLEKAFACFIVTGGVADTMRSSIEMRDASLAFCEEIKNLSRFKFNHMPGNINVLAIVSSITYVCRYVEDKDLVKSTLDIISERFIPDLKSRLSYKSSFFSNLHYNSKLKFHELQGMILSKAKKLDSVEYDHSVITNIQQWFLSSYLHAAALDSLKNASNAVSALDMMESVKITPVFVHSLRNGCRNKLAELTTSETTKSLLLRHSSKSKAACL